VALHALKSLAASLRLAFSDEQESLAEAYLAALYRHNETRNLTRIPREDAEVKHLCDSILPAFLFPFGAEVLDVGTLPGLPAWPLALVRPDLKILAIDATAKGFDVLADCPLSNLSFQKLRIEESGIRQRFDVVTGRAVAPLAGQVELSAQPCRVGGRIICYRTPADREAAEAFPAEELALELEDLVEAALPDGVVRLFPVFRKRGRTAAKYPRSWAKIKGEPLAGRLRPRA
jgi:16S rRNA (guanine527-N7)-methyltransferase